MNSSVTFRLRLFGTPSIVGEGGSHASGPARQRHRIALQALLALSPGRCMAREKLMAYLWPEGDPVRARNRLSVAVYALRKALGKAVILSEGDALELNPAVLAVDVLAFEEFLGRGDYEGAVALYRGPFLDGFFLSGCPEFERWAEGHRGRLADGYGAALEALGEKAKLRGDVGVAVEWWRARAQHDPYDSRVALRLLEAMAAAGNRAGALRHASEHVRLLQEEVGVSPPPELTAWTERLRREPLATLKGAAPPSPGPVAILGGSAAPPSPSGPPLAPSPQRPRPDRTGTGWRRRSRGRDRGLLAAAVGLLGTAVFLTLARGGTAPAVDDAGDEPARERSVAVRSSDSQGEGPGPAGPPTTSIAAYEAYLLAKDPTLFRTEAGTRLALEHLQRAVALDPTYAGAHAALAAVHIRLGELGAVGTSRAGALALAEEAALLALDLDEALPQAHVALGTVRMSMSDFPSAEAHLRRAAAIDPTLPRVREKLVSISLWMGRPEEALAEAERALELDPLSPAALAEHARALAANGRCAEALAELASLWELEPPLLRAGPYAVQCWAERGMWPEAMDELRRGWEHRGPRGHGLMAYVLARAGETGEAVRIRSALLEEWRRGKGDAFALAIADLGLGDLDEVFSWIEQAVEDQSLIPLPSHVGIMEPLFQPLRGDPRLERLKERLGLRDR